ncbi:hypothetical protein HQQ92_21570 [Shewanella sp. DC2-4]|uniref:hypothetical protein n=1 Tax=Shewanella sp. DC2-4 TaxID=2739431 RepID=UPI00156770AB|nr:hypothetical protein [Shewanella sp. DC2-4]NRD34303.1 hypothetical protein [Shewanella sp. DC2-4]
MTKMDRLAPVAQIACLSPVESEFEQLLNLSKRQASSHDTSTFDGEKEAIESHEAEHEEGFIWGHVVPVTAYVPLRQHIFSASKAIRIHSSDAVSGSRLKLETSEPLANVANLQRPRRAIPVANHVQSQLKVSNTDEVAMNTQVSSSTVPVSKSLNTAQSTVGADKITLPLRAKSELSQPLLKSSLIKQPTTAMGFESVANTQVSTTLVGKSLIVGQPVVNSEQATRSQTRLPQSIAAVPQPTQSSPIKSPLISQPPAVIGRESGANAQVSTTLVGKSLIVGQPVVNSEQATRSLTTPPQSMAAVLQPTQSSPIKSPLISQPSAVIGRESGANAQVSTTLVGKSLIVEQPVVNSEQATRSLTTPPQSMAAVPQPTQSSPIKSPPISRLAAMEGESGVNLQKQSELTVAHSNVPVLARVQRESNANKGLSAGEKKEDPVIKAFVPVHSNLEVKEGGQHINKVFIEEKSSVLVTQMELPSLGSKLVAIGAVSAGMTVQPVLSSLMLHYQIAPEYFTQYAQLNTYRVFFRNKYYVFQFEDNKVTNFLEDYYDRH